MREIGKAEQARALGPQPHHLGDDLLVVGRSAVVAAMDEGLKGLLAQIAPAGKLQERLDARTRQRHHIAVETAFFGVGLHGLANEIRQPGKFGFAFKDKLERLLVGQHVLAERGAQRREAFDDRGEAFFGRFIEARAGAAERGVVALDDALLFVGQVKRADVAHQRVDAAKKRAVGVDVIPMACHLRCDLTLDFQERVVAVRAGQHVEHVADAGERPAARLQRRDGVGEARRRRIGSDSGYFRVVLGDGACIGRAKMLGLDGIKRRNPVRGRPIGKKRVVGQSVAGHRRALAKG